MFSDIRLTFEQVLENLWKSSVGGQKYLIKRQRRCHQYANIIKRTLHATSMRTKSHLFTSFTHEILFLALEHTKKLLHISPPCNIPHINIHVMATTNLGQ